MALYRKNSEGEVVKISLPTPSVREVVTSSALGVNPSRSDVTVTTPTYKKATSMVTISTVTSSQIYKLTTPTQDKPTFLSFNVSSFNQATFNWNSISERWGG